MRTCHYATPFEHRLFGSDTEPTVFFWFFRVGRTPNREKKRYQVNIVACFCFRRGCASSVSLCVSDVHTVDTRLFTLCGDDASIRTCSHPSTRAHNTMFDTPPMVQQRDDLCESAGARREERCAVTWEARAHSIRTTRATLAWTVVRLVHGKGKTACPVATHVVEAANRRQWRVCQSLRWARVATTVMWRT